MLKQDLTGEYLEISNIQKDEQDGLLNRGNVVGVGVGHKLKENKETGDTCLSVFVAQKLPYPKFSKIFPIMSKKAFFCTHQKK
ncbi:MAG: hypothetical protein CSB21_00770 [Deltaproteobacteria bacterium]|nr:MAG: hypothetical protein CSB21_00770 [Deltaproteobacteria bacterium]